MINIEQEIRTYNIKESICFRKTTEKFGGLSNMASGYPIVVNDVFIRTSEALYQAMRYPDFPIIQSEIIMQNSPMTAKMISKKYREKTRKDWDNVKIPIMKWSLRIKLLHNIDTFGKLLLKTDKKIIIEESKKDKFWGASFIDINTLEGVNALGRLLMELREIHLKYTLTQIEPLKIDNFKLYGKYIENVYLENKNNFKYTQGLFK